VGFVIQRKTTLRVVLEAETLEGDSERGELDRVRIDVREAGDAAVEGSAAVFLLRPISFDLMLRAPIGQTAEGEGADDWRRFVSDVARTCVVGWENVVDETGEAVPFDADLMLDGTIAPDYTQALVAFLLARYKAQRRGQMGNARSAGSHAPRSRSSQPTRARGIARNAKRSDPRPA
jgi:hypothetical protein